MNDQTNKVYLGDSVYVELEHGMIKLTTENGFRATNEIFLEPEVFHALVQFTWHTNFCTKFPRTTE